MRTVVLNLKRRPDRLEHFRHSYNESGWSEVFGKPRVEEAYDGATLKVPAKWQDWPAGTYGCYLTHLAVIQRSLWEGVRALTVFEDDAVFRENSADELREFLASCEHPEAVWLGGQRCGRITLRTHAFMLNERALRLLSEELPRMVGPVDVSMSILLGEVPLAPLVGQAALRSDVTGQDEPARWWNGAMA